jgi:hypothetical protein
LLTAVQVPAVLPHSRPDSALQALVHDVPSALLYPQLRAAGKKMACGCQKTKVRLALGALQHGTY